MNGPSVQHQSRVKTELPNQGLQHYSWCLSKATTSPFVLIMRKALRLASFCKLQINTDSENKTPYILWIKNNEMRIPLQNIWDCSIFAQKISLAAKRRKIIKLYNSKKKKKLKNMHASKWYTLMQTDVCIPIRQCSTKLRSLHGTEDNFRHALFHIVYSQESASFVEVVGASGILRTGKKYCHKTDVMAAQTNQNGGRLLSLL